MLIGIDGNEANVENRVGVNTYAFEILWNLYKLQDRSGSKHKYIIYLRQKPLTDLPNATDWWSYKVLKSNRPLWILTKLMPYLWTTEEKPDVLFSPSHYTVPIAPMPRVCSIMDLGYLNFSEHFKKLVFWQLKYWSAISIFVSKRIIAISKATANDIVRHYPFASRKVAVTLLSYDKSRFNTKISQDDVRRILEKYSIVDDYILYLGTLKPSKNVIGIIKAYKQIFKNGSFPKLVIAGKKGWLFESIFTKVKEFGLEKQIIFTDFFPEEDKPALMVGAKLLVSPSFWEGFGLHALEAMACGTPVVVSNTGSFPEIVGDAGVLIDPKLIDSMARGIETVLTMPQKRYNELVRRGVSQAEKFSWERTAMETISILEEAYER